MTSRLEIDEYNNRYWFNENRQLHRIGGPAVELNNGSKKWYLNGKLHRLNEPALENSNGKFWYFNGNKHRENGPALDLNCGAKLWYKNGKLHRLCGHAIEWSSGDKEWWINGIRCSEEEHKIKIN